MADNRLATVDFINSQIIGAVSEATVNKPTLYTGTEYSNSNPHKLGGSFSVSAALPYKNGDFYYNTDEHILYTFTSVISSTAAMSTSFVLEPLTIAAEVNYDPESLFAQSGIAVAEAVTEAKGYTDTKIGSIDTALDSIIALQNSYIGGNA